MRNILPKYFLIKVPSAHHDKTDPVLPDGPHVAGGGGDGEEEGDGEQGGAQAAHQAGAEVGRHRLLGGHGDIKPGLLQDVEQQLQAVAWHRHHQHGHQLVDYQGTATLYKS